MVDREAARRAVEGVVKFWKAEKGWGALSVPGLETDVWVHFSAIDGRGFRAFEAGDVVELELEQVQQDSFRYRATRARFIRHGPAPLLRRHGDRVDVVPDGTPDTPLTPRRSAP